MKSINQHFHETLSPRDSFIAQMCWAPAWLGIHLIDWGAFWDEMMALTEESNSKDAK